MSANPLQSVMSLYQDAMQSVLTPEERTRVRIVIVKKPKGAIDLEGPEELKNKVAYAVQARLHQSKN